MFLNNAFRKSFKNVTLVFFLELFIENTNLKHDFRFFFLKIFLR
jgi:hypothetical protein